MTVNRLQSRPWSPLTMVFPPGIQPIGQNLIRWPDGATTATFVTRAELYDTVVVNELAQALGLAAQLAGHEGDTWQIVMENVRSDRR